MKEKKKSVTLGGINQFLYSPPPLFNGTEGLRILDWLVSLATLRNRMRWAEEYHFADKGRGGKNYFNPSITFLFYYMRGGDYREPGPSYPNSRYLYILTTLKYKMYKSLMRVIRGHLRILQEDFYKWVFNSDTLL